MGMEEKINIFDIEMDNLTAKETMIKAMEYLESESMDTIEIMSMDMLLSGQENTEWTGGRDQDRDPRRERDPDCRRCP